MRIKLLLLAFCSVGMVVAQQYEVNLRKVKYPSIEYLNLGNPGLAGKEIRVNNLFMEKGGIPQLPVMGEIHYSRMDHRYWRDALLKMKSSGIDIVATYVIWNLHEEIEGEMNWSDNLNLRRFIELCKELDMNVHLRFGPYCNAEIRNGGLPDWLLANKKLKVRSNDPLYLEYVRKWYQAVFDQVKGLLYKDGGPIMALQLENEYVINGQIIPHLTTLKKMAVEIGFDLPLYTMTHWMDSEYPKGEIVPYAGFYIEAPWTANGKNEIPTSQFEFFSYNRLSDNIGTDIIKLEGDVESLSGENNDSPFFTCEIGVGTTAFYHRRAVVPEEMAGEMINLRLGCGANLMGYYMYAGGTNPVGKVTTMQSSGPRVSYDYQAPVREFGTLGRMMPEVKKYNYFMNDFGTTLAPSVAYLPTTNKDRNNLQWAVRYDGEKGYLFCSNYLYKHERQDFKDVQFTIKMKDETLRIPRQQTTVKGGSYFLWPFNQTMDGVLLKYSTTQPICSLAEEGCTTYFFFEDDFIPGEYQIEAEGISAVNVSRGICQKEKSGYFLNGLIAGKDCVIEILKKDNSKVRFITLTEEESDRIWRGEFRGKPYVALTSSVLITDHDAMEVIDERSEAEVEFYAAGYFHKKTFQGKQREFQTKIHKLSPFAYSKSIALSQGDGVQRQYTLRSLSTVEHAYLRYAVSGKAECFINEKKVNGKDLGGYIRADVSSLVKVMENNIEFRCTDGGNVTGEIEILLKNGERIVWNTDATWTVSSDKTPVKIVAATNLPNTYAPEEHLALYELQVPESTGGKEETRMYISYFGDVANAYQYGRLVADSYYDGTDWIISVDRLKQDVNNAPLVIRIDGLKTADAPIYFEKNVNPERCVNPGILSVKVKQEHRFNIFP